MFARFTDAARETVAHAARLAAGARPPAPRLTTGHLLLALAETRDETVPASLALDPAALRRRLGAGPGDRDLLATLGIDLDEVRRRAGASASLWRMTRSPFRPLRVEVAGPGVLVPLAGGARKVIEVAQHHARRRGALVEQSDLLRGLLADARDESLTHLRAEGVNPARLWRHLNDPHAA
ncbi:hypothetical protein D5H75_28930 [Bailinhaonella thermotolerans]|uniref:Clp R domain-containing protein n=2 Tax=Bailinhaonella thermotolerans TaxID=1070861 RepID=A0A3A4ADH9_9ACTN|nr:hypothetical protein D5H75_28930 [Bailinhaonella thermotolerans]